MEGKSGLRPETVLALREITEPVALVVFIVDT